MEIAHEFYQEVIVYEHGDIYRQCFAYDRS